MAAACYKQEIQGNGPPHKEPNLPSASKYLQHPQVPLPKVWQLLERLYGDISLLFYLFLTLILEYKL